MDNVSIKHIIQLVWVHRKPTKEAPWNYMAVSLEGNTESMPRNIAIEMEGEINTIIKKYEDMEWITLA